MPVPALSKEEISERIANGPNVWIAASDGDLDRVKFLLDHADVTPTSKDAAEYTPLHAAASYGHHDLLRFLTEYKNQPPEAIEVEDDEGDTPLFFCDKEETAKFLVEELGANAKHKNHAGLTAAENALVNDLEDVARYLASVTGATLPSRAELLLRTGEEDEDEETENAALEARLTEVPESDAEGVSDEQVDELMQRVEEIMRNADETGADPTEQLREVVGAGIMRQIMEGYQRD